MGFDWGRIAPYHYVCKNDIVIPLRRDEMMNAEELCSNWIDNSKWLKILNDAAKLNVSASLCEKIVSGSNSPNALKMIAIKSLNKKIKNTIDNIICSFAFDKLNRVIGNYVYGTFKGIHGGTVSSYCTLYNHWFKIIYYKNHQHININSVIADANKFYDGISQYILTESQFEYLSERLKYDESYDRLIFQYQGADYVQSHHIMRHRNIFSPLYEALAHEILLEKIAKSKYRNVKISNAAFRCPRRPRTKKWYPSQR